MIHMKKRGLIITIVICLAFGVIAGSIVTWGINTSFGKSKTISTAEYAKLKEMQNRYAKLDEIYDYVDKNYYTDVKKDDLLTGAYKGLISGLDDPYSSYMTKDEYKAWNETLSGEFEGIGITFTQDDKDRLVIVSVMPDTPAEKAGLKAGDIIMEVDGKTYKDMELASVAIKGKKGTAVKITYYRDGKTDTKSIVRERIVSQSVTYEMLAGNIGYIAISSFEENTYDEFSKAMDAIKAEGARAFILDLRNNGGGLVDQGVKVADDLLGKGVIVYLEDNKGNRVAEKSDAECTALPYVVLVNEATASTSEIVTAAIRDLKGGKIVGQKTYGKGIVQQTQRFSEGSAIKLTVMQYFPQSGKAIHKKGITPDYIVGVDKDGKKDSQLEKAESLLKVKQK